MWHIAKCLRIDGVREKMTVKQLGKKMNDESREGMIGHDERRRPT